MHVLLLVVSHIVVVWEWRWVCGVWEAWNDVNELVCVLDCSWVRDILLGFN